MKQKKTGPSRPGWRVANPLWPLEELHRLRKPPFVPDPEFTTLDTETLAGEVKRSQRSQSDLSYICPRPWRRFWNGQQAFPIPKAVSGLPWRFALYTETPVVPEIDLARIDLSEFSRLD